MTAVKPITFSTSAEISLPPVDIASQILDVANWTDFQGYGPLPGIRSAEFVVTTPEVVGSQIKVVNTDGSSHREEIVEWQPESRLRLRLAEFSAPLSRFAHSFDESWEFQHDGDHTTVVRSLAMHPKSRLTRPILWLISLLLRQALARHLNQLAGGT